MPLKTIFYIVILLICWVLSLVRDPIWGIYSYIINYNISPVHHWWGAILKQLGIRYSLLSAIFIFLGIVIHKRKLNFNNLITRFEIIFLLLIIIMWLTHFLSLPPGYKTVRNALKITKVFLFLIMFKIVVFDYKRFNIIIWILISLAFYIAICAYMAPPWSFHGGRLNIGVGGPDFQEGNFLGAHLIFILPFIGVRFIRSNFLGKIFLLISVAFIVNAIILVRSRGVFLAGLVGFFVLFFFTIFYIKRYRFTVIFLSFLFILAFLYLSDPGFWLRMSTIKASEEQLDLSAKGRIFAWKAAIHMALDYPFLGIGEGNFKSYVGLYDPDISGKDTHNTFLRCLAELGFLGFFLLFSLVCDSCLTVYRLLKSLKFSIVTEFDLDVCALALSLLMFLVASCFITETYVEEFYFFLYLPKILYNILDNKRITPLN